MAKYRTLFGRRKQTAALPPPFQNTELQSHDNLAPTEVSASKSTIKHLLVEEESSSNMALNTTTSELTAANLDVILEAQSALHDDDDDDNSAAIKNMIVVGVLGASSSAADGYKMPNSSLTSTTTDTPLTLSNNNSDSCTLQEDGAFQSLPTPQDVTASGCFGACRTRSGHHHELNATNKVLGRVFLNRPSSSSSQAHHPSVSYTTASPRSQSHSELSSVPTATTESTFTSAAHNDKNCLPLMMYGCAADCIVSPLPRCDQSDSLRSSSWVHSRSMSSSSETTTNSDNNESKINSDSTNRSHGSRELAQNSQRVTVVDMYADKVPSREDSLKWSKNYEFGTVEAVRVSTYNVRTCIHDDDNNSNRNEHHHDQSPSHNNPDGEDNTKSEAPTSTFAYGPQPVSEKLSAKNAISESHPRDGSDESEGLFSTHTVVKQHCFLHAMDHLPPASYWEGEHVEMVLHNTNSPSPNGDNTRTRNDKHMIAHTKASNLAQTDSGSSSNSNKNTKYVVASLSSSSIPSAVDPFAPREGKSLWWERVCMVAKDRVILDHVWGIVPHQHTTAIMGPSGAGKTSLLNILAGRTLRTSLSSGGDRIKIQATIRFGDVDDRNNNKTIMRLPNNIAFVAQHDSLPPTETPREAIRFSAKLRLGREMTNEQLDDLTEYMLEELDLASCADTIVGGPLLKGISGGERKRTSVGVELVVKPAMVFLDEPTSGLDAFSAVQVCRLLKKVANAGASVLFTIHQPSSKIFREFDHLILLNKGRVMYQGPANDVGAYFGARGHPCPVNYNPADWVLKVAQKVSITRLEEDGFFPCDETDVVEASASEPELLIDTMQNAVVDSKQTLWTQVAVLLKREMNRINRDRKATTIRIFQSIVMSSLIGTIFFNVGQASRTSPSNLQSQFGAIVLMSCITMTAPAQTALMAFPSERPIFLREFSTGHYEVLAYFLSRLAMEALICAVQCIIMLTVAFNMIQFEGSFVTFFGACYALGMASTAIAVVLGASAGSNTKLAACLLPLVLMPQFLFIGYFIVPEMIPAFLRWLRWLCPMGYAIRILIVDEFDDCSNNPFENLGCEALLDSVEAKVENLWWYWLILVAQFVLFRLTALAILKCSVKTLY